MVSIFIHESIGMKKAHLLFMFISFLGSEYLTLGEGVAQDSLPILQDRLEKAEAEVEGLRQDILTIIREENNPDKPRYKHASLIFSDQSGISHPLSRKKAYEIVSRNELGEITQVNKKEGSRHPVSFGEGVHFKTAYVKRKNRGNHFISYPLESSDEISAYYFHKLLFDKGVTPSLFCIINVDRERYFVQATKSIPGCDFSILFDRTGGSASSIHLDSETASNLFVISLLTCPLDYKENNFIITPRNEIYCIDNDRNFYFSFLVESEKSGNNTLKYTTKNILFLLPNILNSSIHVNTLNNILSVTSTDFIKVWLGKLHHLDIEQRNLMSDDRMTKEEYLHQNMHFLFNFSHMKILYHQLNKLQFLLKRTTFLTHGQLFEFMNPLLFSFYHHARKKITPEQYCFSYIFWDKLSLEETLASLSQQNNQLKGGQYLKEYLPTYTKTIVAENNQCYVSPGTLLSYLFHPRGAHNPFYEDNDFNLLHPTPLSYYEEMEDNSILKFDLQEGFMESQDFNWIPGFFARQENITHLNLCDNHLEVEGLGLLVKQFPSLTNLTFLNLSGNQIGNQGIMCLAENGEEHLQKLSFLGLNDNNLTNECQEALFTFLFEHSLLETVDLRNNHLTDPLFFRYLPRFSYFDNLSTILFKGNKISRVQKRQIQETMIAQIIRIAVESKRYDVLDKLHQFKNCGEFVPCVKDLIEECMINLSRDNLIPLVFDDIELTNINICIIDSFLNAISSLDRSKINKLEFYRLTPSNYIPALFNRLSMNKIISKIKNVYFFESGIRNDDEFFLVKMLYQMRSLKVFKMHYQQLIPLNFLNIVANLPSSVEFVSFKNCFFSNLYREYSDEESSFGEKKPVLPRQKTLHRVTVFSLMKENLDTSESLDYTGVFLRKLPNLTDLRLCKNTLTAKGAFMLLQNVKSCPLQVLDLSRNIITPVSGYTMENYDFLSFVPSLHFLNLSGNPLGDEGIFGLLPSLKLMTNLKVLKLSFTQLTDNHILSLCDCFKYWKNLEVLKLSNNSISSLGASIIFGNLPMVNSLRYLDLSYNKITPEINDRFFDFLRESNVSVNLTGNDSDSSAEDIFSFSF